MGSIYQPYNKKIVYNSKAQSQETQITVCCVHCQD